MGSTSYTYYDYQYYSTVLMILLLIVFLVKYLHLNFRSVSPLPPGLTGKWPVLGCLPEMWTSGLSASQWIHQIMKDLDTEIACIRLGNAQVVVVSSPEIAREFLKKHDLVFASRPVTAATRIMSHGFLTTAFVPVGEQWKKMRKVLMSQILSKSRLLWLLNERDQEADDLVRFVYNQCSKSPEGEVINMRSVIKHFPANMTRRMVFGTRHFGKVNIDGILIAGEEEEEHVSAIFTLLRHIYAFSVSDYLPCLRMLDIDGHQRKVREAMKIVQKYHDPIVNDRVKQWREGKKIEPEDLLDVFISLKDSHGNQLLSVDEIRAQIVELFLAGIDNQYNTVEWALSELLNQPEFLEKAVEELDSVVGKERLMEESDICRLPYVVSCAREALRLHPVTPFNLPHVSSADSTVAGYFIPKGSIVLLSRLGLGRNPNVWADPLRFDPGRHVQEGRVDLAEAELRFVSFTTGTRGCVGAGLGSNMILMLLGRLLQGFTWNVPQGLDKIDLASQSNSRSLFKATPLSAHATRPRLNPSLYFS